jgi:hypothetical protein
LSALIHRVRYRVALFCAADAMFRREDRDKLQVRRIEEYIDGSPPITAPACLVRDQPDPLHTKLSKLASLQHVETRDDLPSERTPQEKKDKKNRRCSRSPHPIKSASYS